MQRCRNECCNVWQVKLTSSHTYPTHALHLRFVQFCDANICIGKGLQLSQRQFWSIWSLPKAIQIWVGESSPVHSCKRTLRQLTSRCSPHGRVHWFTCIRMLQNLSPAHNVDTIRTWLLRRRLTVTKNTIQSPRIVHRACPVFICPTAQESGWTAPECLSVCSRSHLMYWCRFD